MTYKLQYFKIFSKNIFKKYVYLTWLKKFKYSPCIYILVFYFSLHRNIIYILVVSTEARTETSFIVFSKCRFYRYCTIYVPILSLLESKKKTKNWPCFATSSRQNKYDLRSSKSACKTRRCEGTAMCVNNFKFRNVIRCSHVGRYYTTVCRYNENHFKKTIQ